MCVYMCVCVYMHLFPHLYYCFDFCVMKFDHTQPFTNSSQSHTSFPTHPTLCLFSLKRVLFLIMCVSMCGYAHINTEARGFGCPKAGIIGSYKTAVLNVGLELRLSGKEVHAFNC